MADRIQLRRDTSTNWTSENPVLASGEQGFETDTLKLKIGNGVSAWNSLAYVIDVSSFATSADVTAAVDALVDTAPGALDTLNELAAALGDDADFAGTVTTSLAAKANSADLATVATTGAYSDLTGTPTLPSALTDLSITDGTAGQVLSADGDGTYTFIDAASGGSGGTASFTSTTNLTAGDLVALSTSGTVSGITTQAQVLHPSPVQPVGAATKQYDNVSVAKISDTKYILAYRNNSGYPVIYIATVEADNTVTTGTPYTFSTTTSSEGMDLFWDPINEVGVVVSTTASQVKYQYFTVIGNAISYQGISGAGNFANQHHAVYNYETNEIWVAWMGENFSARYGGLQKAVWNGSTISITNYGLGFTLRNEKTYNIRAIASWGTDKVIGQWYDGYDSITRDLVFNTSTGTWTAIATGTSFIQKLAYNSDDNIVIGISNSVHTAWVEYSESGGVVTKGSNFPATTDVDGNAITWGHTDIVDVKFINGKTYILSQSVYEQAFMYSLERTAQNNYNIELIFNEAVPGSYDMGRTARDSFATCGSGIVYVEGLSLRKLDFADLSVTNIGGFIGISTETVTANNPAVISIVGGINTNQSGLTPNLKYYATAVGALTTTLTDYPVGIATSATSLLVTESYTSTQKKIDLQLATVATTGAYSDLTGTPTGLATETYVTTAVSNLVDTAPDALNTLNELAAALGDDANFAGTVTTSLAAKANSADLATVATTGAYSDLTGTPTVPADVSDLTDTTSLLGGGGGSFEAVASGSLSDGSTVVLNADGTVSVVYAFGELAGSSSEAVTALTSSSGESRAVYDSNSNKVVLIKAFRDANWQGGMRAVVGTVSGGSITFGPATIIYSTGWVGDMSAVFDSYSNKVVVMFRKVTNDPNYYPEAVVATVSGNSISAGSPVVINSGAVDDLAMTFDSTSNKVVFLYRRASQGKARVGTVSGTSISVGAESTFTTNIPSPIRAAYDPIANKVIVVYRDATSNDQPHAYRLSVSLGTVSGTSISFGSQIYASSEQVDDLYSIIFATTSNKVIIYYRNPAPYYYGKVLLGTVSGSSIGFTTSTIGEKAFWRQMDGYDPVTDRAVLTYYNLDTTETKTVLIAASNGAIIPVETNQFASATFDPVSERIVAFNGVPAGFLYRTVDGPLTTNLTAENYAGIADAAYADAATATIQTAGSVDDAQSGLTPGQAYYVQGDGTLALNPATPRVFAGVAASATKLLIGKEGPAVDLSSYASTTYVDTAVSNLVDTAPDALNTLNELAAALNDDADFAGTVTTSLSTKLGTDSVIDGGTV
jgi:hypothetical protein